MARDPMIYERQKETEAAARKDSALSGFEETREVTSGWKQEMNRKEEAAKAKSEEGSKPRTTFQKVKERLSKTGIAKQRAETSKLQSKASAKLSKKYPYDTYTKIKKLQALEHPNIARYRKAAQSMTSRFSSSIATQGRAADISADRNARLARINQQKRFQQLSQASGSTNRYAIALEKDRQFFNQLEQNRQNSNPINTARERNRIRQLEVQRRRENTRNFSILQAHRNMLTPREIAIDFTGTQNNILTPNPDNNILRQRPDSISILKKRRNILDTKNNGNDLKFF